MILQMIEPLAQVLLMLGFVALTVIAVVAIVSQSVKAVKKLLGL